MEKNSMKIILFDKLTELNRLEMNRAKILTAIYIKTMEENVDRKIQALEENIRKQAELYSQDLMDYQDICAEIMKKYKEQIDEIVEKYNEMFINIQMELQEAECDQKITMINFNKSCKQKNKFNGKHFNKYAMRENKRKINACIQKKYNYDVIIQECEEELDYCSKIAKDNLNQLFGDQLCKISLNEIKGTTNFFGRVRNLFVGKGKFKKYCLDPIELEIKVMEEKLPEIQKDIHNQTVKFITKIRQMKNKTNIIYSKML